MRTRIVLFGTPAVFLLALPLFAQTPSNPLQGMTRFAGTVTKVDPGALSVEVENGGTTTFELPDSVAITRSAPATMKALAAGKFVGCTAVTGSDGALRATECHIFPESMRGRGEGHNPMGPPNTTMTNGNITATTTGTVTAAGDGVAGVALHVAYEGGAQDIGVSAETRITQVEVGDESLLKPGVRVNGAAREAAGGVPRVEFLNVTP